MILYYTVYTLANSLYVKGIMILYYTVYTLS